MPIVNEGKLKLSQAQNTYLATLKLCLFTNDVTIDADTTNGDIDVATWPATVFVDMTSWSDATIVMGRAQKVSDINAEFANSSGSVKTYYGWALVDEGEGVLIAALNQGLQSVPDGSSVFYMPVITDTQE